MELQNLLTIIEPFQWIVAVLGIIALFIVSIAFSRLLLKMSLLLVKRSPSPYDDEIAEKLSFPVVVTVCFLIIYIYPGLLTNYQDLLNEGQLKVISQILVLVIWARSISAVVSILVKAIEERFNRTVEIENAEAALPIMKVALQGVIWIVVFLIIADMFDLDITALLASAGIAGLAIAFAAQETIANLFGGITILLDKPFKVGDFVIIDEKHRGEVVNVGIRSTKIRTRDWVLLSVPNSLMVSSTVVNETGINSEIRAKVTLGVDFDSDLEKVEDVFIKVLESNPQIINTEDLKSKVRFREYGPSSINIDLLFWVKDPSLRGRVTHQVIKDIQKAANKEKIMMPPPKMVIINEKPN